LTRPRRRGLFRRVVRALPFILTLLLCGGLAPTAHAEGSKGEQAKKLLTELSAQPEAKELEPLTSKAERALERARALAGDSARGALSSSELENVALAWANAARSLLRALRAEAEAQELEERLAKLRDRVKRARALIEETRARVNRVMAELRELEREHDAGGAGGAP
jgi:hypothetical protein